MLENFLRCVIEHGATDMVDVRRHVQLHALVLSRARLTAAHCIRSEHTLLDGRCHDSANLTLTHRDEIPHLGHRFSHL